MIEYIIILFILLAAYIMVISNPTYHKNIFLILGGVLVITAGFREAGITNDYDNYISAYNYFSDSRMEPTFILIATIVKNIFKNPVFMFLIYAALGVSLKFIAFKQITRLYLLSALLYISNFFLLHEMTQIRAGVASALLLLCVKPLCKRDYKKFIIISTVAVCFHYSAIIIFALWFLDVSTIKKYVYLSIIPLAYVLALNNITLGFLIENIPVDPIRKLYASRVNERNAGIGEYINIFNSLQMLRIIIVTILIYYHHKLYEINKYSIILIKIYTISIVTIPLFMDLPVVSFRVSELLGIVEIILIPFLIYLLRFKKMAMIIPICIAGIMLWINLFYVKLIIV